MEQRFSVITIAADNLTALRDFYIEKLDWKPIAENKDIVFFKHNGFLFSICKRTDLAEFIGISPEGTGFRSVTFSYNVSSKGEAIELYFKLKNNGVKIIKEPTEPSFGGYFFYFSDIEGNILEVAYNPFIPMDYNGNVITHKSIEHL
jgi:predicted enzyme related to lactoylglutathione lyase